MLGDEAGIAEMDQPLESPEMLRVERIGRAQGEPDTVQTQWIKRPQRQEIVDLCSASGEVVFAVGFEPADLRTLTQQVFMVLSPQADTGSYRHRPARLDHIVSGQRHYLVLPPTMRSQVPVGTLIQSFLSEVVFDWPEQAWPFDAAIVLASLGNAVTLFGVGIVGGLRQADHAERKQAGHRG